MEPFVDEKGRVIEGFASTGYDGSESDTEEEEESKGPKITFFGDPYEFMQDFIRFSPAGENQGNREGFEF